MVVTRASTTFLFAAAASVAFAQHRDTSPHHTQPVATPAAAPAHSSPPVHVVVPTAEAPAPMRPPVVISRPTPIPATPHVFQQQRPPIIIDQHRNDAHHNTNGHQDTSNQQHRDTADDNRRHANPTTDPNAGINNATNVDDNQRRAWQTDRDRYRMQNGYYLDGGKWRQHSGSSQSGTTYYRDYAPFYYYDSNSSNYYGSSAGVTYLGSSSPPTVYDDSPNYSGDQLTYIATANPATWCDSITVTVTPDKQSYIQGEDVHLSITTDQTAYIYVYTTDSSGVTQQLLPNYYDRSNFIRPRQVLTLPSSAY
ncbi:MAG: DUF4384 domain-containing protein, partial [Candidatus Sumerlaeota bacterium]